MNSSPPGRRVGSTDHRVHGSSVRVSSMQLRALCEGLEHAGVAPNGLLAGSGIEARRFDDPAAWFTVDEFDRLMVSACRLSADPAFGLHWGERAPMAQFDQVTILAATAPSLRAVLTSATRFQALLASRNEYRFAERGDTCVMTCDVLAVSEVGRRVRAEFLLAATRRLLQYFGAANDLLRVRVPHPRPSYGDQYERLFGPVVQFDQPSLRVEFARVALDRSRGPRDLELHDQLRDRVERLRQQALGQLTFTEQTEAAIRAALPKLLSMAEVAAALQVSTRSLRRRLSQDDTNFSVVVEQVRRQVVDDLLSAGKQSVKEIASEAGYSGVSAFYRAFRRWTGDTPGRQRAPRARSL